MDAGHPHLDLHRYCRQPDSAPAPGAVHVCVARHGETDWNIAGILQGWIDVEINEQGRRQARDMAAEYAGLGFSTVGSSPLRRAMETAEIVAYQLGLPPPLPLEGLRERNFGAIQGVPKSELADLNPILLQQVLKRNPDCDFEAGETMDDFADRVMAELLAIPGSVRGERMLVITHGWVMDVITRHIHHLPRSAILNVKRRNGEALWLEVSPGEVRGA